MTDFAIDQAKAVEYDEDEEVPTCEVCGAEGSYVLYDGDKTCKKCGDLPEQHEPNVDARSNWERWWDEREHYSGWHGENRIRFIGGFQSAY